MDFQSYPLKRYPHCIDREIVRLLLELKELPVEYPQDLHDATRAAYIHEITTKKASAAGTTLART